MFYGYRPYVPVAVRRRQAAREMAKLTKKGHAVSPVVIEGRAIARTFWGKAWCDNLERYSDYENRLPRGRTYVRNGSVVDLQIAPGEVKAMVSGSQLYKAAVKVSPLPKARWHSISKDCAGAIDSLVELLQGRFSKGVMERICQQRTGLFPSPDEIKLSCSCPDWASMCKHVAAVLYGIGARLDERPELLFTLREVDEKELIAKAGTGLRLTKKGPAAEKVLDGGDLSEIFGLEMAQDAQPATEAPKKKVKPKRGKMPVGTKTKAAATRRSKARSRGKASEPRAGRRL
ncbi:MAG: SWIM zinc finger family protein [Candidatus Binatia bacterium]